MSTVRNWCFTLNNPTEDAPFEFSDISMNYLIYQKEAGENGTPHFQGYVQLKRGQRLSYMKKINAQCHWEPAKGSPEENKEYCTKEEGRLSEPVEFGSLSFQGKRSDLGAVVETIRNAKRPLEEVADNHPFEFIKYTKGIKELCNHHLEKKTRGEFRNVDVSVYWGKTGTGKTRKAYEENKDCYILRNEHTTWFDGYNGQETLIIDEFKNWIPITTLLGYLDGYQLRLPIKGSFTYAQWTKVIITSNIDPNEWYPNIDEEHKSALFRRLKNIICFSEPEIRFPHTAVRDNDPNFLSFKNTCPEFDPNSVSLNST